MVVLIFGILLTLFSLVPSVRAGDAKENLTEVLFDTADPQKSVGIMGDRFLEVGDIYERYRVISFTYDAAVLENQENREAVKFVKEPVEINPKLMRAARHLFVVKQMRAIYEAEVQYLHEFENGYAPDLETLIRQGFLADGFRNGIKQDYFFQIVETRADFGKEPVFFAVAEPGESLRPDFYFSVDHLGLVRYADSRQQASWGPAWDYMEHSGGPRETMIGVEENKE